MWEINIASLVTVNRPLKNICCFSTKCDFKGTNLSMTRDLKSLLRNLGLRSDSNFQCGLYDLS